jgi:hypothetical protein
LTPSKFNALLNDTQLSLTVGAVNVVVPVQSPVVLLIVTGPEQVILGPVLSVTVTVNEHCIEPHKLVAVIVIVVTPLLNRSPVPVPVPLPDVAPLKLYEYVGAGEPEATAEKLTTVSHEVLVVNLERLPGQVVKTGVVLIVKFNVCTESQLATLVKVFVYVPDVVYVEPLQV